MPIPRSAILLAFLGFVFQAGISAAADLPHSELVIATAGGARPFKVEIADNEQERARGLMFRRSLPKDEGMLFDFQAERPVGFWMRNTYVPLDMLFIRADGTVDSIAERTTPLSEESVPSKVPVRYVLEINAGLSRALGIHAGDKVSGPALGSRK